jgi:hypothetical protein
MSLVSGTPSDPFSQAASLAFVKEFEKLDVFKGFNTELWEFFTKEFFVWDKEETETVLGDKNIVSRLLFSHLLRR